MNSNTVIWIIVAVVIVLALIALIATLAGKRRKEAHREEAAELREDATSKAPRVAEREQQAEVSAHEAQQARATADEHARIADEAERRAAQDEQRAGRVRSEHDDALRRADAIDPDVRTDSEGNRLDDGEPNSPRHASGSGRDERGLGGSAYDERRSDDDSQGYADRGRQGGASAVGAGNADNGTAWNEPLPGQGTPRSGFEQVQQDERGGFRPGDTRDPQWQGEGQPAQGHDAAYGEQGQRYDDQRGGQFAEGGQRYDDQQYRGQRYDDQQGGQFAEGGQRYEDGARPGQQGQFGQGDQHTGAEYPGEGNRQAGWNDGSSADDSVADRIRRLRDGGGRGDDAGRN
ncbi:hypothetical protein G9U51_03575 [Calidifontibacter sp. DB0510]|uniref:Uncharacterized protein n=1 Tax=Metallococcus carri TaxID=1656884 RepID=A0A967AY37_9MICO|nr:hypothetical protein [Metallococcus carri]NHN54863.1 hypothetical protein [Metallococcus carri]NOP37208.1 hypothetical protein [Calidifontibacter sp. DB2511S]